MTSELGIVEFGGSSGAIVHQIRYLNTYSTALRMDISGFDSDMLEVFFGGITPFLKSEHRPFPRAH